MLGKNEGKRKQVSGGRGDEWQKIKWDTKTAKAKELTMISTNYWPEGTLI